MTAKKCTKKRDARAKLLFYRSKPIVFLPFSLPSPSSLLKLPNIKLSPEGEVNSGGYIGFRPKQQNLQFLPPRTTKSIPIAFICDFSPHLPCWEGSALSKGNWGTMRGEEIFYYAGNLTHNHLPLLLANRLDGGENFSINIKSPNLTGASLNFIRLLRVVFSSQQRLKCRPVTSSVPENRVVILIGWLSKHSHNYA